MSKSRASNRRGGSTMNLLHSPDRNRLRRPGIPDRKIPFVPTFSHNTALRLCASSDVPSSSTKDDIKHETTTNRKPKSNFHEASEGSDFLSDSSVAPQSNTSRASQLSQLGLLKHEHTSSPFEVQHTSNRPEDQLSRASSSSCLSSISCSKAAEDPRVSETLLGALEHDKIKRQSLKFQRLQPKHRRNRRSKAPMLHELQDGLQKLDVPKNLVFKQSPDRKSWRALLTLNNVSMAPMTYFVRTSAPDMFITCPSMGIIDPRTSAHVVIKLNGHYRFKATHVVGHEVTVDAMTLKTKVLLNSRKRLEQFWQAIETNLIPQDRIERHSIHDIFVQNKAINSNNNNFEGFPTSCCPMMLVWDQKTSSSPKPQQNRRSNAASIPQTPKITRSAELAAEHLASDIRTTSAWFILSLFALILLLFSSGSKLPPISEAEPEDDQLSSLFDGFSLDLAAWFEAVIETFTTATWPQECLEMLGELCEWIMEQVPPSFASIVSFEFVE